MTYAKNTKVPVAHSRAAIEQLIARHGATRFANGWEDGAISIMFEMRTRRVRFYLPLPQADEKRFLRDGNGKVRTAEARGRAHDTAVRERWRALLLVIKAKLESVETGVTTFEEEFLAHIILPTGGTIGEWAIPLMNEAYRSGTAMPPLLGAGPGPA